MKGCLMTVGKYDKWNGQVIKMFARNDFVVCSWKLKSTGRLQGICYFQQIIKFPLMFLSHSLEEEFNFYFVDFTCHSSGSNNSLRRRMPRNVDREYSWKSNPKWWFLWWESPVLPICPFTTFRAKTHTQQPQPWWEWINCCILTHPQRRLVILHFNTIHVLFFFLSCKGPIEQSSWSTQRQT